MTDRPDLAAAMESCAEHRRGRRDVFKAAVGLVAAGSALAWAEGASAQSITDADILNFALNLEYLEAQFYAYAATGTGLAASLQTGTGTQGAATGGRQVQFTDPIVARIAREIAADEAAHVTFLRNQLGSASAVAQPALDISASATGAFSAAARAAGLVGAGVAFDPYASDTNFLLAAFLFEDVGVTAYKGAATLISSAAYIDAAAGLLAAEAYHAAIIRTQLVTKGVANASLVTSAQAISDARDSLDGGTDIDQGITPGTYTVTNADGSTTNLPVSNIVPTDANASVYSRSTTQVLNIVYLNSGAVSAGGFFPAGLNGTIKTSAVN